VLQKRKRANTRFAPTRKGRGMGYPVFFYGIFMVFGVSGWEYRFIDNRKVHVFQYISPSIPGTQQGGKLVN
jgi:hypothetical protein